jgi:hypothetical protein
MNWAIVMVGGPAVLATVYYFIWGRKIYSPPNDTVEDYIERYEASEVSFEKDMSVGVAREKASDKMVTEEIVDAAEPKKTMEL